jgi:hypothetical protein
MPQPDIEGKPHDFSLVLGGPVFQFFRKSHLSNDGLDLLRRRIVVITSIAWLPLAVLAWFSAEKAGRLSFFHDIEVHVRFLLALPILIAAELVVHSRIRRAVSRFVDQRLVPPHEISRFNSAIDSAMKLRNSISLELGLLLLVYTLGLWLWHSRVTTSTSNWYALSGNRWDLTAAGRWYVFVSLPIVQFILLRWYMRLFIWFRFLWQVSKLNLHLIPTHPDRCAGLAFLGKSSYAFGPILFAQGTLLAGLVASRVLYGGQNLLSFKLQIVGFIAFFVLIILAPLVMFTPQMAQAKRKGLADYGLLAQSYVAKFERKWVLEIPDGSEDLLGTGDIQSLADLGNSYALVRDMRALPFGLEDITRLAAATAAPLLPLLFTVFSPEEIITRIVKILF